MAADVMMATEIVAYGAPFGYRKRVVPELEPDEVLVRVVASGLCSTDLHLLEGRWDLGELPRVPGHETAGIVESVGNRVSRSLVGTRVTVALDVVCGRCVHCRTGQAQRCPNKSRIGFERDGGHAEYVAVPAINVVELPESVGFEAASILPDAVACMYHSLVAQGQVGINDTVVIHGSGGLGVHGVQIATHAGARVMATSRSRLRRDAAERYGAVPVDTSSGDAVSAVVDMCGAAGVDIVADCIGTEASIRESLAMVRPGGRVLVLAYVAEEFRVNSKDLMANEKQLIGCRGSTYRDLQEVVELVANGVLEPVIGARVHLSKINEAADSLRRGEVSGRIVLTR